MANKDEYELPLRSSSSHIHVASRKTLLSSSDMVIPLICGICLHLFYMTLLLPILVLYFDDYNDLRHCMSIHFEIYLILALLIHTFTLITNLLSTIIAFQTKVLNTSKWLNILLSIRLLLNVFEIFTIFYGFIVIFISSHNRHCFHQHSTDEILHILIAFNLLSNLCIVLLTWFILFCCCTTSNTKSSLDITQSHQSYNSLLNKYCSICFYDQKSPKLSQTFHEMGGLITILMRGNPYDHLKLTPSDIITGLHLLRMLQKHYGEFDFHKKHMHSSQSELYENQQKRLNELKYYTIYANATYGIGLYTLSKPCAICCASPCLLPNNFNPDILARNEKCSCVCESIQIDNSNLKVFIQRTGITNINDLLLVQQIGDVNKVNFYVCIDHIKQALVISLRGSMSISDSITDIQCEPMHFPQIDEHCFVHRGIGNCAKYVFDIIVNNERILNFLQNNPLFDVVLVGHSLGAGVCVILSLMIKYGVIGVSKNNHNLKLFITDKRRFKAFAIAPPSVIERSFILKINSEISEFLTCVIYGYDIIPRLSFKGVVFTRAAINRLLCECVQTPWWIYEKSITIKHNTIINALKHDTKYLNNYIAEAIQLQQIDDDENKSDKDILPGQDFFINEVLKDVQNMEEKAIEQNLSKQELWNTRFCQSGFIFHIVNDTNQLENIDEDNNNNDTNETENMQCIKNICKTIWKSVISLICNLLKCRICLDSRDTKYYVYRANPDSFCDKLLISPYLLADHMPQVYLNVLQNARL